MPRWGLGRVCYVLAAGTIWLAGLALRPAAASAAQMAGGAVTIQTSPALQPAFDPAISDYVVSCEPAEMVTVKVSDGSRTPVVVDGQPVARRNFSTTLPVGENQAFAVTVGSGRSRASYTIRCLPSDFPAYSVQLFGAPQAAYYLVTPSVASATALAVPYVVLFDAQGVPVWWYREPNGTPLDADVAPNGDITWDVQSDRFNTASPPALTQEVTSGFGIPTAGQTGFAVPLHIDLLEYQPNGTLVNTVDAVNAPTDFHEGLALPNGDFLMSSYVLRTGANLSPVFPGFGNVLDAVIQEVTPKGTLAGSWDLGPDTTPAESQDWSTALDFGYPGVAGQVWDDQHIDSIAPDGDGYLVALRNTDAVYLINAADGSVEWKLGGTTTPESLKIIGDPDASTDFGGPNDARVWPDGTISLLDNGTNRHRPPRVLRFQIDTQARTATLVQVLSDPAASRSSCCGSARLLAGGNWLVDWGDVPFVEELTPAGIPVMRLNFSSPYYTYRAVPVSAGQLSLSTLTAGMNAITPRTPTGKLPPLIASLRVAAKGSRQASVRFALDWPGHVSFALQRCVRMSYGGVDGAQCARYARIARTTRTGGRGSSRFVIAVPGAGAGLYRVVATPFAGGSTGEVKVAHFRLGG